MKKEKSKQTSKLMPELKHKPKNKVMPEIKQGKIREIKKHEKLRFRDKFRIKRHPDKSFLVTMLFSNGTNRTFIIATRQETFTYKKRTYYLKYEDAWFDLSHNQYRLFYFDDYPVPIDRAITRKGNTAYFTVTPENLKPLLKMEYVKALAQSHEISKFLKLTLLLGFVNGVLSVAIAGMVYNALYR